jgi:four helix bundle protein
MVQSFRDLKVWQKSMELATTVYRLTQRFPREETYGITAQMRRSAVSMPSNIAEGHGRLGQREYRQFLSVARGSNFELQTQIEIARSIGLGEPVDLDKAEALSHEIGKMIYAIAEKLPHLSSVRADDPKVILSEP